MARLGEVREPVAPSSAHQRARYRRILQAAAAIGSERPLDHVQMQDIAKDAGVAIATLYRYFPSKAQLFTALLHEAVGRLDVDVAGSGDGSAPEGAGPEPPDEAVAHLLLHAAGRLLARPLLAQAMLQSNNATVGFALPGTDVQGAFAELILRVAGIPEPTDHDRRLIRLVQQTWYGVLTSRLTGHIDDDAMESDTRLACRLLLRELGAPSDGQRPGQRDRRLGLGVPLS